MLIDFWNYFTFIVSSSFEIKSSMKMIPSHTKHVATVSCEIYGLVFVPPYVSVSKCISEQCTRAVLVSGYDLWRWSTESDSLKLSRLINCIVLLGEAAGIGQQRPMPLECDGGWRKDEASVRFLQRAQCSHCKRCISYGNSVRLSVRHMPVLCQNEGK